MTRLPQIGIINFGMGNIQSVKNSLDYLRIGNQVVDNPKKIDNFAKLILPGVGAFGQAMERLTRTKLAEKIKFHSLERKKPLLGICLGMQLLFETSCEHGQHQGLGLVKGKVKYLGDEVDDLAVPHVGWNEVKKKSTSRLLDKIKDDGCFYFVHSYYCHPQDQSLVTGTTEYGFNFASVIETDNILGCQFHPEKSQQNGLTLLKNFASLL